MNKPEILAPAGAKEQLIAAARSGADAVYLGAKGFNARRNAENFGEDTLKETVSYCHARNVKVYVTLNILVLDNEMDELISTIHEIAKSGADAVIVQDLAAARLVKECMPTMPLHASTQMAVHNLSGAKALEQLGFKRVVLARELSLCEIKEISENTNLETEVFVHGALCMSISGMCYLSSIIGGRSGNRGLCAQPCRLNFRLKNKAYALSLKDNTAVCLVPELISAGVTSFKIEGRMKRPEYVAAAVDAFRKELSGEKANIDDLCAVFSRSGFTNGYLINCRDKHMFGIRTKEDVQSSISTVKKFRSLYKEEFKKIPLKAFFALRDNELILRLNDITVTKDGAEKAVNKPLDFDTTKRLISKMGDTPFYISNFEFENNNNLTAPASLINSLRREALSLVLEEKSKVSGHSFTFSKLELPKYNAKKLSYRVRLQSACQLSDFKDAEKIILPLSALSADKNLISERTVCEIDAVFFKERESKIICELSKLKESGLKEVLVENIGALYLAKKLGFDILGGSSLNITNSLSLFEYEKLGLKDATLSFELNLKKAEHLKGNIERGIIGYGYLPLMRFRACPAKCTYNCSNCPKKHILTDRIGKNFTMLCEDSRYSVLLNSTPLYIGDKEIKNLDFATLYFTTETKQECKKIFESFKLGLAPEFERTNGLYFRELL